MTESVGRDERRGSPQDHSLGDREVRGEPVQDGEDRQLFEECSDPHCSVLNLWSYSLWKGAALQSNDLIFHFTSPTAYWRAHTPVTLPPVTSVSCSAKWG